MSIVKNFLGGVGQSANIYIDGLLSTDNVSATNPFGNPVGVVWEARQTRVSYSIPTMTDNTHPSGVASASQSSSGTEAYKAFDKDRGTFAYYTASFTNPFTVAYDIGYIIDATQIDYTWRSPGNSSQSYSTDYKIQISTDGTTWTDVATESKTVTGNALQDFTITLNNVALRYVRIAQSSGTSPSSFGTMCVTELNVLGYKTESVPCWHISAKDFGNYTISAQHQGQTLTETVLVDVLTDYEIEMGA